MAKKLLLVSEFNNVDTETGSRYEVWQDNPLSFCEYTCTHKGGRWRKAWEVACKEHDLEFVLAAYDFFLFDKVIESDSASLCGVAISRRVPMIVSKLLLKEAHWILSNCWEFNPNYNPDYLPVARTAFLGAFRKWLPRNLVGSGCWAVQFQGLRACQSCAFKRRKLCLGQETVRTGKNDRGIEIPILNGLV